MWWIGEFLSPLFAEVAPPRDAWTFDEYAAAAAQRGVTDAAIVKRTYDDVANREAESSYTAALEHAVRTFEHATSVRVPKSRAQRPLMDVPVLEGRMNGADADAKTAPDPVFVRVALD